MPTMPFATPTRLQWGALLALLLPFVFAYTLGPSGNMLPLIVGLFCAGLFVAASPQGHIRRGSAWALLALPLILALHSLAAAPATPSLLLGTQLALLVFALVALCAAGWVQAGKGAWIWGAVLLAALLNSAIALLQYKGWAAPFSPWLHPGSAVRTFGNLRQPNQLATLCSMGYAVVLVYAPRIAGRWRSPQALWLGAALLLLAVACALSRSRTGLLQWLMVWGAALCWAWQGRKTAAQQDAKKTALALILWASLGLVFYASAVYWLSGADVAASTNSASAAALPSSALARLEDSAQDARVVLWDNVLQVAAQKPWVGWGWGNLGWGMVNTPLQGEVFSVPLDNAHNLPLHLAAELGWPLAILFCAAVLLWLIRRKPWRETRPAQRAALLVLALIGLHSLLEYPLWHAPFWLSAALAFGVLAADGSVQQRRNIWLPRLGWGIAVMAIVLFLSWVRVAQIYLPDTQRWLVFTYQDDWAERNAQSWWFAPHADFARMGQVALTPDNATEELRRAQRVLHYSSEVKVLRRARDAAALLGDEDLASHYDELIARRWPKAVEVKEKTH
jgi:O-antigen ligase